MTIRTRTRPVATPDVKSPLEMMVYSLRVAGLPSDALVQEFKVRQQNAGLVVAEVSYYKVILRVGQTLVLDSDLAGPKTFTIIIPLS